jgi:hypothetical protein
MILSRERIDNDGQKVGVSITEVPNHSMGRDDFRRANCISICGAARSSTAQPCDRVLDNFIRLGFQTVFSRFGIVELVRQFLGHSSDQGRVIPDHAEYWNRGRKKLPFKAATTA